MILMFLTKPGQVDKYVLRFHTRSAADNAAKSIVSYSSGEPLRSISDDYGATIWYMTGEFSPIEVRDLDEDMKAQEKTASIQMLSQARAQATAQSAAMADPKLKILNGAPQSGGFGRFANQ